MGLVHRRELLILPVRAVLIPLLASLALSCGGLDSSPDNPTPDTTATDAASPGPAAADTTVTLVGTLPDGSPMPPAENAGGIPPYPGARVHVSREQTAAMRSFEAFTPDSLSQVVEYFDSQLGPPAWSRRVAEDMVIYEKGDDEAAITVSPWEPEHLRPGAPAFIQEARTAIGAAWRPQGSR